MPPITTHPDLAIGPAESQDDLALANDLIEREHPGHDGYADRWRETWGCDSPGFELDRTRIARWRGEFAGTLRIHSETLRLGEARLRMGGLGWVTTDPQYRSRGIAHALIQDAMHYLRLRDYHLAVLFGSSNLHYPLGFVTALGDHAIVIETLDALQMENPYRVRAAKPGDVSAMLKLHNANDSDTACSVVRTSGHFKNKWKQFSEAYVLTDAEGMVNAYFFTQDCGSHLAVEEVCVLDRTACMGVLSACSHQAADASLGSLRFLVPPTHPLAHYLTHFHSRHESEWVRDGGGMMALLNMEELFESMLPEWESRLATSIATTHKIETTLCVGNTSYRIRANRGAIDCATSSGINKVRLTSADFIHLLTGYAYLDDILDVARPRLDPEARLLLMTLFPKRSPYIWPFDRF